MHRVFVIQENVDLNTWMQKCVLGCYRSQFKLPVCVWRKCRLTHGRSGSYNVYTAKAHQPKFTVVWYTKTNLASCVVTVLNCCDYFVAMLLIFTARPHGSTCRALYLQQQ